MKNVLVEFPSRESIVLNVCSSTNFVVAVYPFNKPDEPVYLAFESYSSAQALIRGINAELNYCTSTISDLKYGKGHSGVWKADTADRIEETNEEPVRSIPGVYR